MVDQYLVCLGGFQRAFQLVGPVECVEVETEHEIAVTEAYLSFCRKLFVDDQVLSRHVCCEE